MRKQTLFLGALFLLLLPAASRADIEYEHKKNPCADNHADFCPREKPKTKSYLECMEKHLSELAPACREQVQVTLDKLKSAKEKQNKAREACRDDFFTLCQGVPYEEKERKACLLRHKRKLSEACLKTLQ